MTKSKPEDKYTKEAKKLLAWWQESLREQWQHPDTLNAWLSALGQQNANKQGTSHATKRPIHADDARDDELQSIHAELRTLRTKLSKLERELASVRRKLDGTKPDAKPVRSRAAKPVRAAAKSKPKRRPKPRS